MYKNIIVIIVVFLISLKCTSPSFELKGIVRDGFDGSPLNSVKVVLKGTNFSIKTAQDGSFSLKIPFSSTPGVFIENYNSVSFLKKSEKGSDIFLFADKNGYQRLEYKISSGITSLTLNILPNPVAFQASDYKSDHIPNTSQLTNDVKWEDIIDGVRLFYEKRVET